MNNAARIAKASSAKRRGFAIIQDEGFVVKKSRSYQETPGAVHNDCAAQISAFQDQIVALSNYYTACVPDVKNESWTADR